METLLKDYNYIYLKDTKTPMITNDICIYGIEDIIKLIFNNPQIETKELVLSGNRNISVKNIDDVIANIKKENIKLNFAVSGKIENKKLKILALPIPESA